MKHIPATAARATLLICAGALSACSDRRPSRDGMGVPLAAAGGFSEPEAVRYDPDQDVFFVSNFAGDPDSLDNNGFISRVRPDGSIEQLRFVAGGANGVTLHSPRGLALHGDTLWAVDADALRGFDRKTGASLAVVDFGAFAPGFLNDVTVGGDGALYITDTGRRRIHRVRSGTSEQVAEAVELGGPNGITWDREAGRFLVAPYFEGHSILAWQPGQAAQAYAPGTGGGYDGVEIIGRDSALVASQADSSLHVFTVAGGRPWLRLRGAPADIGVDVRRRVVAVPYVDRDTVELFRLP